MKRFHKYLQNKINKIQCLKSVMSNVLPQEALKKNQSCNLSTTDNTIIIIVHL